MPSGVTNESQKGLAPLFHERFKVIGAQVFWRNAMRREIAVEHSRSDGRVLDVAGCICPTKLEFRQILGWSDTTDDSVGSVAERRLIDNRVVNFYVDFLRLAPGLREDVM